MICIFICSLWEEVISLQRPLGRVRPQEYAAKKSAETGFTLVEIMVVLLIIAILLSIAIPTFLGTTASANDRAVQSNLSNGLIEAATQYQAKGQSYSGISAALKSSAPEFTWTSATTSCSTSQPNCISVDPVEAATSGDTQGLIMAAMSKTGTCWWVAQLQATPAVVAPTGFLSNATVGQSGNESTGSSPATIATAGSYYAKESGPGAAATCNAAYPMTASAGFNWGPSYSTAGAAG